MYFLGHINMLGIALWTTPYSQLKRDRVVRPDFGEIKGDTANSAGGRQT